MKASLLTELLLRAAGEPPRDTPAAMTDETVDAILESGIGPLLFHLVPELSQRLSPAALERVQAARLTAEFITRERFSALRDLLVALRDRCHTQPVLLKGVAVASAYYPARSLRTMADTDLLLAPPDVPAAETELARLGYRPTSSRPPEHYRTHHHSMPMRHRETGLWVELHTALNPPHSPLAQRPPLDMHTVRANCQPWEIDECPVARLAPELELVYIACHWAVEWRRPGSASALFDVVFLLQQCGYAFDWSKCLDFASAPHVQPCVKTLLRGLAGRNVIRLPETIERWLAPRGLADTLLLRARDRLLERYVLAQRPPGRFVTESNLRLVWDTLHSPGPPSRRLALVPWHLQFPPQRNDRFRPAFHVRRLRRALARHR